MLVMIPCSLRSFNSSFKWSDSAACQAGVEPSIYVPPKKVSILQNCGKHLLLLISISPFVTIQQKVT